MTRIPVAGGTGGRIRDFLRESKGYLASRGVEEPSLSAEILLSRALGLERSELFTSPDRPLKTHEQRRFHEYLDRRGLGEPIQYITGRAYWLDFDVLLKRGVFIPRPETETLVEAVVKWLKRKGDAGRDLVILDVGTGSGNIAIGLARQLPGATVYASDISLTPLLLARKNSGRNGMAERVHLVQGDLLKPFQQSGSVDVIASNPPYVRTAELEDLQVEVRSHEPESSLDGGADGLRVMRDLIKGSPPVLGETGLLAAEMGMGQSSRVEEMAISDSRFTRIEIVKDLNGTERVALMEV